MATKTIYRRGGAVEKIDVPDVPATQPSALSPQPSAAPAAAWLEARVAQRGPRSLPLDLGGAATWVKKLSFGDVMEIALMLKRNADGDIDLSAGDTLREATVIMAVVALYADEACTVPFFDHATARTFADEEEVGLVSELFNKITAVNPAILPKKGV